MLSDLGCMWFAMRTSALKDFKNRLMQCDNPYDEEIQARLAEESGLNLFNITEKEYNNILCEVENNRWY